MARIVACGDWSGDRGAALARLKAEGYEVESCCNGGPLECVLQKQAPDVLLYAVNASQSWEASALQVVHRIHPRLPIVVLTGDGSVEERLRLEMVRPAYVAVDPIEPAELAEAIQTLLERRVAVRIRPRRSWRIGHGHGHGRSAH